MDIQTRKLHFIQEILVLNNERIMKKLENILYGEKTQESKKSSPYDLLGVLSKEEADRMEQEIEASCEQIHQDDWR